MTHIIFLKPKKQHGSLPCFIFILYPTLLSSSLVSPPTLLFWFPASCSITSSCRDAGEQKGCVVTGHPMGLWLQEGKVTGRGGASCSAFAVQGGYPLLHQQVLSPRFLTLLPLFPPDFGRPSHTKREAGVARNMTAAQLPLLHTRLLWGLIIFALL